MLRAATLERVQEVMGGADLDFRLLDAELLRETEFVVDTECVLPMAELLLEIDVADKLVALFSEDWLVFGGAVVLGNVDSGLTVLDPPQISVVVGLADHCKDPESALLHQQICWGIHI